MMTQRQKNLEMYLRNSGAALFLLEKKGYTFLSSNSLYEVLAYHLDHSETPTDVIHEQLTVSQIVQLYEDYICDSGSIVGEVTFDIDVVNYHQQDSLEKATVKLNGKIWRIHLHDADPFPSNPHAHLVGTPLKLHLGNGFLYNRRILLGKVPKKEFTRLKNKIKKEANIELPKND